MRLSETLTGAWPGISRLDVDGALRRKDGIPTGTRIRVIVVP